MNATGPTGMESQMLSGTVGALALGTFASTILYGISILQLYRYLRLYPRDNTYIKALVIVIMILETLHTILPMHTCYYYLVTNYFKPSALAEGVWSLDILPVLVALIVLMSQVFFARRVSLMGTKYKAMAAVAVSCLIGNLALCCVLAAKGFQLSVFMIYIAATKRINAAAFSLGAIADFILSSAIIIEQRRVRASQPRHSLSKIDVATLYILNSGLLTGLLHGCTAILTIVWPSKQYWAAASLVAVRFYAITLLAVLNSRKFLVSRGMMISAADPFPPNILTHASRLAVAEQWNVPRVPDAPPLISVNISSETEVDGPKESNSTESLSLDHKDPRKHPV